MTSIPIATRFSDYEDDIAKSVKIIIDAKQANPYTDTTIQEHQIDQMVYELYGLTPEEIEIVEGSTK